MATRFVDAQFFYLVQQSLVVDPELSRGLLSVPASRLQGCDDHGSFRFMLGSIEDLQGIGCSLRTVPRNDSQSSYELFALFDDCRRCRGGSKLVRNLSRTHLGLLGQQF